MIKTIPVIMHDTLSLVFGSSDAGGRGDFAIGRFVEARCGDADLLDDLKPSAPFVFSRKVRKPFQEKVEEKYLEPAPKLDAPPQEKPQQQQGVRGCPVAGR